MATITSPDFPGERLIVCRNRDLAGERTRKRNELLDATERQLAAVKQRVERNRAPLRGKDKIGMAVGAVINRHNMAKHFDIEIGDDRLVFRRKEAEMAAERARDGIYVIRTSLPTEAMEHAQIVASYKSLSRVERAFRSLKTVDLEIRPIYHWLEDRVRAHVLLCMLAYHVEWHMRRALAPMLYEDEEKETLLAMRSESGDQSSSLGFSTHQGRQPSHIRRLGRPQLPEPRRRPRDALPQYARHRAQPELRDHRRHPSHIEPGQGVRPARHPRPGGAPREPRTVPSSTRRLGHKALSNQCDVFSKSKKFRLERRFQVRVRSERFSAGHMRLRSRTSVGQGRIPTVGA